MIKKLILFSMFLILVLLISACNGGNGLTGATVVNLDKCDDNNKCTNDFLNSTSNQCEHVNKVTCCGNGECEIGECENLKDNNICTEDCTKCINNIFTTNYRCEGDCEYTDVFKIKGNSSISFDIVNKNNENKQVKVSYECKRLEGGFMVFDSYGIKTSSSFSKDDIVNVPTQSMSEYKIQFSGKPKVRTELKCDLYLENNDQNTDEVFYLMLEP